MAEVFARKDTSMAGTFRRRVGAVTSEVTDAANRKVEDFAQNVHQNAEGERREALVNLLTDAGRRGFLPREVVETWQGLALAVTVNRVVGDKVVLWDGFLYDGIQTDESVPPKLGDKLDAEGVFDEVLAQSERDYDEHPAGHGRIKTYPDLYPVKSSAIFHKVKVQEPGPHRGRPPAPDYILAENRQELADSDMIGGFVAIEEQVLKTDSPEGAVLGIVRDARERGFVTTRVELFMDGAWNVVNLDALEEKFDAAQSS